MSSVFVDRVGRRPLLVFSYLGTAASLTAVGSYFFLQEFIHVNNYTLKTISFIPFVGIILASVISILGFSSLINIIPAEIFPINVKAIAMTCLSIFSAAVGFGNSQGYRIKDYGGYTTVFGIFAGFGYLGSAFSYLIVPETKGKDLRDIQADLQGAAYGGFDDTLGKVITRHDENKEGTELEELEKKDLSKEA